MSSLTSTSVRSTRTWFAIGIGSIVVILIGMALIGPRLRGSKAEAATSKADTSSPKIDLKTTVLLPEGKLKVAGVALGKVARDEVTTEVGVPGQITINTDRRVEIRPRVPGVVRSVAATLGMKVKAGQPLVTLDSADIGSARLNLRARQRELATARIEAAWKLDVATNVEALIPLLRKNTPAKDLEKTFRDKSLGTFRGDLMGSYAEFEVASHEEEKQSTLNKQGLVGEHPVFVTQHNREAKQARFEAQLEQVRFDVAQQTRLADQQVRAAEAAVIDAAQRLRILGVSEEIAKVLAPNPVGTVRTPGEYEDVTVYEIVAPFEGTIVARSVVPSQRVELTDPMFTLADLTTVRVTANVPESRVGLLSKMGKPTVIVNAPAYPGRTFEAKVIYVGEEVDPATRTVGLIAELPNPDGMLRPGMFVRILIGSPEKATALTVPSSALIEIDGKNGVFRPGKEPRSFVFAPVSAGAEAEGRRAILSGLNEGDPVVTNGAFTLKSELVLQNETEED